MSKVNVKGREEFYKFFDENRFRFKTNAECIRAYIRVTKQKVGESTFVKYLRTRNVIKDESIVRSSALDDLLGTEIEQSENTKKLSAKTDRPITSLEEALAFFEVDTTQWKVANWKCKSWDTSMKIDEIIDGKIVTKPIKKTNYLVNVQLTKIVEDVNYEAIYKTVNSFLISDKPSKREGSGVGVVTIADIHAGLRVEKLTPHTQEFNLEILTKYLEELVIQVNALKFKEVHVVILGDLIESVTGYNKIETLKEMEFGITSGGNMIILAYELIHKLITKINNVVKVYMISGNHDRLTPDKPMDKDGGAAQIVAYMLNKTVPTKWHPVIMKQIIDDICYILTHGHHKLAHQDLGKLVFEYGEQSRYNVILSAHFHVRKTTKVFQEKNLIMADTNKYRAVTIAPIVTGNRWVEENGWSSSPGFSIFTANFSKTNVNHFDFALNRPTFE